MSEDIHTFCRVCEPQCGLVAKVEEGRVVSLRSDPGNPASKGFSCNKGIQYLHVHHDPDRPTQPLRRGNPRREDHGDFTPVSWDDAMADIGARLNAIVRSHGDEAIALFMGNPHAFNSTLLTNEDALMAGFGAGPRFGAYTIDCANKLAGSEAMFGTGMVHPIPDLVHTDYFLALGTNPAVSHMAIMDVSDPMEKLRAIRRRGGKTVFINPRLIESATPETGEVVLIRPDTDFYFLAAVLHEIIFVLGCDQAHARSHGRNVDGLIEFVKGWPAERAAEVTGIPLETIRRIAREFHSAPSASIQMSTGVNMGAHGLLAYWMVQMISLLTGNLGRRGGNFYSPGICPTAQLGKMDQSDPFFETEFGRLRKIAGQLPSNMMADVLRSTRHPVKALIVVGGNPILSVPGEQRLREALQGLDLIVSIDIYRSATGELADYILPAKDFLEREDVNVLGNGLQLEPHVQYSPAVVEPKGERRDDWWILARMLQAMGRPSLLDDPRPDPFGAIGAMLQYRGLTIDQLKQLPFNTAILPDPVPDDLFRFGVQTDDGLIDCCPLLFEPAKAAVEEHWRSLRDEPADQLKLITRRTGLMVNSWMCNLPIYKKGAHMTNPLWMNPADASARGLRPGGAVIVQSDSGEVTADLVLDDTLKPGVVAMSHGWGHDRSFGLNAARRYPGANVNRLSPSGPGSFDPLSMQARLTGINVEVTASPDEPA
jgi:anaerobic selenocysteine-containing dehydrogenase